MCVLSHFRLKYGHWIFYSRQRGNFCTPTHTHTPTHIHTHPSTHLHTPIHPFTHTHTHTHTHTPIHPFTHTHTHTHTHTPIHHLHTYTHTHTYTRIKNIYSKSCHILILTPASKMSNINSLAIYSIGTIFQIKSSNVKLNIDDVCNLIRMLKARSTRAF